MSFASDVFWSLMLPMSFGHSSAHSLQRRIDRMSGDFCSFAKGQSNRGMCTSTRVCVCACVHVCVCVCVCEAQSFTQCAICLPLYIVSLGIMSTRLVCTYFANDHKCCMHIHCK